MLPVLTPDQARAWDLAAEAAGRPLRMLMENAGRAVAQWIHSSKFEDAMRGVLVLTGAGNNGGDGWVAARQLHLHAFPVTVVEIAAPDAGIAAQARRDALDDGVQLLAPDAPWPQVGVVIDAMLGSGAHGPPRQPFADTVQRVAGMDAHLVAIDGPTGLDLATGVDHGALRVATTITFGGFQRGHVMARDVVGDVYVMEVGHPAPDPRVPTWIDLDWATQHVPVFAADTHKAERGRVVVIGGESGMTGAARLAARSAFAGGAGLVELVVPEELLAEVRGGEIEALVKGHPLRAPLQANLRDALEHSDAVVIGPGLGREPERAEFVLEVIAASRLVVVDADGLTVLAPHREALARLTHDRAVILTPHRGEFRTLFGEYHHLVAEDPWAAATMAAEASGATVLLKGVPTIVAHPGQAARTITDGNPGLATGGSGDVLAGLIGSLLGQRFEAIDAASMGACLLGLAADFAIAELNVHTMRPLDVIATINDAWRYLTYRKDPDDGQMHTILVRGFLEPPARR